MEPRMLPQVFSMIERSVILCRGCPARGARVASKLQRVIISPVILDLSDLTIPIAHCPECVGLT